MKDDSKKYYGKYGGIVFDNNDPKLNGRIKCLVPKIGFDTIPTNWAIACLGYEGEWKGPDKNTKVWVEFEGGDRNIPIWSGAFVGSPGGKSELPERAKGVDDGTELFKGIDSVTLPTVSANEPASDFGAVYPRNIILKTKEGIIVEYDDTKGKERIQLFHPTGSFIEMRSDGKVVIKSNDDLWQTIGGTLTQHILGNFLRKVEGNQEEESVNRLIEAIAIKLGKNATFGLIMENFGNLIYNLHTHVESGGGTTLVPGQLFVALTHATQKVTGE
jgi:hypothetical protein